MATTFRHYAHNAPEVGGTIDVYGDASKKLGSHKDAIGLVAQDGTLQVFDVGKPDKATKLYKHGEWHYFEDTRNEFDPAAFNELTERVRVEAPAGADAAGSPVAQSDAADDVHEGAPSADSRVDTPLKPAEVKTAEPFVAKPVVHDSTTKK